MRAYEIEAECTARIKILYRIPRHPLAIRPPLVSLNERTRLALLCIFFFYINPKTRKLDSCEDNFLSSR